MTSDRRIWLAAVLFAALACGPAAAPASVSTASPAAATEHDDHAGDAATAADADAEVEVVGGPKAPATPAPGPSVTVAASAERVPLDEVPAGFRLATSKKSGADRFGDPLPKGAVQRLGSGRFRVVDPGMNVQLQFAGDRLEVAARVRYTAVVRDAMTGKILKKLGDGGSAANFSVSPDRRFLASGCGSVRVTDLSKGTHQQLHIPTAPPPPGSGKAIFGGHYERTCVAFDGAGKYVVTAMDDGDGTHLWDPKTGKKLRSFDARCDSQSVAMAFDGTRFACTNHRGVQLWRTDGTRQGDIAASSPTAVAFSRAGDEVAVADSARLLVVGVDDQKIRTEIPLSHRVQAVAISDDGKWVAAAASAGISIYERATGRAVPTPDGHLDAVSGVAWSDNDTVFTGSWDGRVLRWSGKTGEMLGEAAARSERIWGLASHGDHVASVRSFTKDGSYTHAVQVFEGASGRSMFEAEAIGNGYSVALTPEFVVVGGERSLEFHALAGATAPRVDVPYRGGGADRMGMSANGEFVAFAARMSDTIPQLVRVGARKTIALKVPRQPRPDRSGVGMGFGESSRPRRKENPAEHDAGMSAVAFSRDGKLLATGERASGVHIWSVPDGAFLGCHRVDVSALAFDASGRRLFAGTEGGWVYGFDAKPAPASRTGKCTRPKLREREGHLGPAEAIALSPDGRHVVSGGRDGMAIVWRASNL